MIFHHLWQSPLNTVRFRNVTIVNYKPKFCPLNFYRTNCAEPHGLNSLLIGQPNISIEIMISLLCRRIKDDKKSCKRQRRTSSVLKHTSVCEHFFFKHGIVIMLESSLQLEKLLKMIFFCIKYTLHVGLSEIVEDVPKSWSSFTFIKHGRIAIHFITFKLFVSTPTLLLLTFGVILLLQHMQTNNSYL